MALRVAIVALGAALFVGSLPAWAVVSFDRPGPPDALGDWAECNIGFSDVTAGSGRTLWMSCVYGPVDQAVTEAWVSYKQGASPGTNVQNGHFQGTGSPAVAAYTVDGGGLFRMTRTGVTLSSGVDTTLGDQPLVLSSASTALSIAGNARQTRYWWATGNMSGFPSYPDKRWPGANDDTSGTDIADADAAACLTGLSGWGFLNPLNYVRGLVCSLKRLFIPTTALSDSWSALSASASSHYPLGPVVWALGKVVAFATEVPAGISYGADHPPSPCVVGPDVPLDPMNETPTKYHVGIINACADDDTANVPSWMVTARGTTRLFTSGVVLFGLVMFLVRLYGWVLGNSPPPSGGEG